MNELLHDRFRQHAAARPDATAVVWKNRRVTYGELDETSGRLARVLVGLGCRPGDRVALLCPKLPEAIVAMVAVLKTGAAYVPLDPADPPRRLGRILRSTGCRCVLGAGAVGEVLEQALAADDARGGPPIVGALDDAFEVSARRVEFTAEDVGRSRPLVEGIRFRSDGLALILFTSGSTGEPKGVMLTHASATAFISWATDYFRMEASDRLSQHPPLRFDVATFDVFAALSSGAELHLVPPELNLVPHQLAEFIRVSELTQWFSVPSMLNLLAKFGAVEHGDFPHLRRILFAGEVLPTPTLIHLMRRLPHVQFTNLYGPTETTIASSYYTVPECPRDDRQPIPIGRACGGEGLLVLDAQLEPVPTDCVGDLYIRGVGLSPGYWADHDKTREAFVLRPGIFGDRLYKTGDRARRDADGLHYFHGRADTQIKSRGYRIELGEIEAALHTLPMLTESAVVAIDSEGFEGARLCCAYVAARGADVSIVALRQMLARHVPAHMLPAEWRRYDALPKNPNGKCDRLKLKEDFQSALRTAAAAPRQSLLEPETVTAAARTGLDALGGVEA